MIQTLRGTFIQNAPLQSSCLGEVFWVGSTMLIFSCLTFPAKKLTLRKQEWFGMKRSGFLSYPHKSLWRRLLSVSWKLTCKRTSIITRIEGITLSKVFLFVVFIFCLRNVGKGVLCWLLKGVLVAWWGSSSSICLHLPCREMATLFGMLGCALSYEFFGREITICSICIERALVIFGLG